jgi:hypothetical protein
MERRLRRSFVSVSASRVAKLAWLWFDARMRNLLRVLSMTAVCGLLASCELLRENKILITCHVQSNEVEHPSEIMRLPIGGQELTFKKVPEFSQRSIAAL